MAKDKTLSDSQIIQIVTTYLQDGPESVYAALHRAGIKTKPIGKNEYEVARLADGRSILNSNGHVYFER